MKKTYGKGNDNVKMIKFTLWKTISALTVVFCKVCIQKPILFWYLALKVETAINVEFLVVLDWRLFSKLSF